MIVYSPTRLVIQWETTRLARLRVGASTSTANGKLGESP